jgi:hypothetical protein
MNLTLNFSLYLRLVRPRHEILKVYIVHIGVLIYYRVNAKTTPIKPNQNGFPELPTKNGVKCLFSQLIQKS